MRRQPTDRSFTARLRKLPVAAATVLSGAMLLGPLATHSSAALNIQICVNSSTGAVRFAPKPSKGGGCSKKETGATFQIPGLQGPQGPIGPQGPAGPPGPAGPVGATNGWSFTGDAGKNPANNFLGTTDNQPMEIRANNSRVMRYEPAVENANEDASPNLIGGDATNSLAAGVQGITIGGGGGLLSGTASSQQVRGDFGTIGGGVANLIRGGAGASLAGAGSTIAGGSTNTAGAPPGPALTGLLAGAFPGQASTIGGGAKNGAIGFGATVTGGIQNLASGNLATVAGGFRNQASADFSFAAGSNALAQSPGSFVWSDTSGQANQLNFTDSSPNQFRVRATGGVLFETAIDPQNGQFAGGCAIDFIGNMICNGTFNGSSDRNMKDSFKPVAGSEVLKSVAALPMTSWTFKGQKVRHIGPMAQDFYSAFKVGTDDKHISTTDAQGVALAAIQGLYHELQAKDAEIAKLSTRLEKLERESQVARDASSMHPASAMQRPPAASITGF